MRIGNTRLLIFQKSQIFLTPLRALTGGIEISLYDSSTELNNIEVTRFKLLSLPWFDAYVNLYWYLLIVLVSIQTQFKCNRWKVCLKGTTSVPKSVPRLVLDNVRQVLVSEVLNSNILMRSGLQHRHLINIMDVTILTTSLRPIFTVTLV